MFDGDNDPQTRHYGAFAGSVNVGCVSFMLRPWDDEPAFQLRGMATAPQWQRRGAGAKLLAFAEDDIARNTDLTTLWCNARVEAVSFYEKFGWQVASEQFFIPGVGPHHKMLRQLSANSRR